MMWRVGPDHEENDVTGKRRLSGRLEKDVDFSAIRELAGGAMTSGSISAWVKSRRLEFEKIAYVRENPLKRFHSRYHSGRGRFYTESKSPFKFVQREYFRLDV